MSRPQQALDRTPVTPETFRDLIKRMFKLVELPLDLSFRDAGLSHEHLMQLQTRIARAYMRTVTVIHFGDNCYTLTDRFNAHK